MSRKPTGRPRGRQLGSGALGLGTHDEHTRLTLRIPHDLYIRLEAFAAGRHFHRGSPKLATYVRDAIEHYLTCPTKGQTRHVPGNGQHTTRQTSKEREEQEDNTGQTENILEESVEPQVYDTRQTSKSILPPRRTPADDLEDMPLWPVEIHPQPAESVPAVSQRVSTLGDRASVLTQLDAWKRDDVSLQKMADHLNAAHVPTFSGKGTWKKGTIGNLLAQRPALTMKEG